MDLLNVLFVEPHTKERIASVWSLCDVALVHLRNAPLFETVIPSKMFEAMAMGLPILLASPKGEATYIVEREDCGIAVPPESPQHLAAAVNALLNDPGKTRMFATHSMRAAATYSRERQARSMLISLQQALENKSRVNATSSTEANGLEHTASVNMSTEV